MKKNIHKRQCGPVLLGLLVMTPLVSFAQVALTNPLGAGATLPSFINMIIEAVITIAFPFLVLMMVYTGFLFVNARGNEQKLVEARRIFTWTLIGALLVLGAQALSYAIESTVIQIKKDAAWHYEVPIANETQIG